MFDIKLFQQQVKALSDKLDTKSPERRVMYLVSEVGEVVDEVLDLLNIPEETSAQTITEIKDRLGMELYDVIWNAVDLANMLDIDLEAAFEKKAAINTKRRWSRSGVVDDTNA